MASQFDSRSRIKRTLKTWKHIEDRRLIDKFLPEYYPAYGPSQMLCDSCTQNGVQKQLLGRKRGEGAHLGTLEELRSHKDCQFCALILDVFANNSLHLPVRAEFHTWRRPDHTIAVISGRMQTTITLESNLQALGRSLMLVDRPIPARADLARLRNWLRECERGCEAHVQCARVANANSPKKCDELVDLILFDVKRRCLVEYRNEKPSNFPRYVALSYVWGASKTLKTTGQTLKQWKNAGSLSQTDMPNTIRNAFHVVRDLGETYLWVDQLCIIQDDEQHKQQLIPRMHEIYRRAVLTIVAVSGEHADAGLPGIRSTSRSHGRTTFTRLPRLTVLPFRRLVVTDVPSLESVLLESQYDKRAWTLQERLLSRRRVYFTKIGMYFDCFSGTIPECGLESNYASINDPLAILRANTPGRNATVSRHHQFKAYTSFVEMYSNRSLGFSKQVLDACAGLFSDIQEYTGGDCRHFCGIPPKFFELSLLWIHVREQGVSSSLDEKRRNRSFPTWSWAGWSCQVSYALSDWISSLEQGTNLSMCCQLNPHRIPEDEHLSFTMLPELISDSHALEFTASVIDVDGFSSRRFNPLFRLAGDIHRQYEFRAIGGGATKDNYGWHYGAELFYGTCDGLRHCGTLFDGSFDDLPIEHGSLQFISLFKIKPPNSATYEIFRSFVVENLIPESILIGAQQAHSMRYPPTITRYVAESPISKLLEKADQEALDEAQPRFNKIIELFDEFFSAVHLVMLIEWKEDHAERIALGQIAEFAWRSAGPREKSIRLG